MMSNNYKPDPPGPIPCAEFQEQLPDLFAAGDNRIAEASSLREHLDTCENCSALVRDLQYIAEQASLLLLPVEEEPSESVWEKIRESLDIERASQPALNGEPS